MTSVDHAALDRVLHDLPRRYPGPGGVVAVVKDGVPIARHAWGFANLETRAAFSTSTLMPVCSITKQFTCATMLSVTPDPSDLDPLISSLLPQLSGPKPTTRDLANNQSGIRDYWAMTVLCGASPEGDFRPDDAVTLLGMTRSLHFKPGTAYSYSNGNFRLLALAMQNRTGTAFGDLVMKHVVQPAAMETASFDEETGALPGGAAGYEGNATTGWRPGINRIHWSGDAGLTMSIDDLIAWERYIDRTRDDAGGLYNRLAAPLTFANGSPAGYGLGLVRRVRWGRVITGHGGAIRGWRLQRFWLPAERLSVDLALNHESDCHGAAMDVLASALGESTAPAISDGAQAKHFVGTWLDARIGLLLDIAANPDGTVSATYDGSAKVLGIGPDGVARGFDMTLTPAGGGLAIHRPTDGILSHATPIHAQAGIETSTDLAGIYLSDEVGSELEIFCAGGCWFAGFRGFLGTGPMMPLSPVAPDLWRMSCLRSLDAPAPGDWTMQVERRANGAVTGVTIGCWLARNVAFRRA